VGHARSIYQQDQNNRLDHIADRAFLWVSIAGKEDAPEEQAQGSKVMQIYEVSEAMFFEPLACLSVVLLYLSGYSRDTK